MSPSEAETYIKETNTLQKDLKSLAVFIAELKTRKHPHLSMSLNGHQTQFFSNPGLKDRVALILEMHHSECSQVLKEREEVISRWDT